MKDLEGLPELAMERSPSALPAEAVNTGKGERIWLVTILGMTAVAGQTQVDVVANLTLAETEAEAVGGALKNGQERFPGASFRAQARDVTAACSVAVAALSRTPQAERDRSREAK